MNGLCFRCEHRALNKEDKSYQMRYECGTDMAVYSCYMFRPVVPPILVPSDKKDKRPFLGAPFISSRACSIGASEGKYRVAKQKKGYVVYWEPRKEKK